MWKIEVSKPVEDHFFTPAVYNVAQQADQSVLVTAMVMLVASVSYTKPVESGVLCCAVILPSLDPVQINALGR